MDLQGNTIYGPGWHFGFNWPAFIIVMLLTVVLVRGIKESAETNNIMVFLKIVAIMVFVSFAARFIHPANWHPFAPNGWPGILTGGSIVFFTYIGFDSVSTAAEECKNPQRDLPRGIIATLVVCTVLYIAVVVVLTGLVPWQTLMDDAAPVVNTMKKLHFGNVRLIVSDRRVDGDDLLPAGVSAGPGARVVCDVARRIVAADFWPRTPAFSNAGFFHLAGGIRGGDSRGIAGHRHAGGSVQYRNAVCVRVGRRGSADPALSRTGAAPELSARRAARLRR